MLWKQLLIEADRRLSEAGHADASLEARRIVERASGCDGAELFLELERPVTNRGVHFFGMMLERRLQGEPLQYVLGRWSFRTLDLFVDRRVLIPRPETEIVVDHALAEVDRLCRDGRGDPLTVVDLGTGSGAIALSIAVEREGVHVWATDRSPGALAVARANLAGLGRAATRVLVVEGDWFEALPPKLRGEIDVIVSNPPYVAETDSLPPVVADWEPREALVAGPEGTEALHRLVDEAATWLSPGGALVLESAPTQAEAVLGRARARPGFEGGEVHPDLSGRARVVVIRVASTAT